MNIKFTVLALLLLTISLHAMDEKSPLLSNGCPQVIIPIQEDPADHQILSSVHNALLNGTKKYTDLENDPIFSSANYHNLSRALPAFKVEGPSSHLAEYFEWKKAIENNDYIHFSGLAKSFSLKLAQEIELPKESHFFEEIYEDEEIECTQKKLTFCQKPKLCSDILLTDIAWNKLHGAIPTQSEHHLQKLHARLELTKNFFEAFNKLSDKKNRVLRAAGVTLWMGDLFGIATLITTGLSTISLPLTSHPVLIGSAELLSAAALFAAHRKLFVYTSFAHEQIAHDLQKFLERIRIAQKSFEKAYWKR